MGFGRGGGGGGIRGGIGGAPNVVDFTTEGPLGGRELLCIDDGTLFGINEDSTFGTGYIVRKGGTDKGEGEG